MKNNCEHRNITELYKRIMENNVDYELRNVALLSIKEQNDIYSKAYGRFSRKLSNEEKTQIQFIRSLFSILHAMGLTIVTPEEAVIMYKIYLNALYYYPQFAECSYATRIEIMHEGYMKGRIYKSHDIYVFSKEIFLVLANRGLIDTIVCADKIENVNKRFNKVYERRQNRTDYENPSIVWEYNALIYVMYEYKARSGDMMRTSFHVSDLWSLLNGVIIW